MLLIARLISSKVNGESSSQATSGLMIGKLRPSKKAVVSEVSDGDSDSYKEEWNEQQTELMVVGSVCNVPDESFI